jgi:uncharacterized DUF497 family protein
MKTVGNEVDKIRKIMGFILESKKIDRPYSEKSKVNYNKMKHSDDYVEHPDFNQKFDYDEIREVSIGTLQGFVIVTVAHTERNGKLRLISARKATPKERRQYYEYLAETS